MTKMDRKVRARYGAKKWWKNVTDLHVYIMESFLEHYGICICIFLFAMRVPVNIIMNGCL